MSDKELLEKDEIFSKVLRAGRRTYFFDVRATKAGDYYLTITESKKFTHDDGSFHYKKHKIYLYKEDFSLSKKFSTKWLGHVFDEKGEEVISEQPSKKTLKENLPLQNGEVSTENFTDINFDDI